MFERVREIICEKLVMAFEDEFNIEIDDEQSENIETVGNVVSYLESIVDK